MKKATKVEECVLGRAELPKSLGAPGRSAVTPVTERCRDQAWAQLGPSGSGNQFVEFGTPTLTGPDLGLEAGIYLALLSHSGSRGTGAEVARHYSKLAMDQHKELT